MRRSVETDPDVALGRVTIHTSTRRTRHSPETNLPSALRFPHVEWSVLSHHSLPKLRHWLSCMSSFLGFRLSGQTDCQNLGTTRAAVLLSVPPFVSDFPSSRASGAIQKIISSKNRTGSPAAMGRLGKMAKHEQDRKKHKRFWINSQTTIGAFPQQIHLLSLARPRLELQAGPHPPLQNTYTHTSPRPCFDECLALFGSWGC
ncbi:hypothetical protein B0T22DRAFT_310834 [Podospora appendiculata]|uniref:Uncharacterized protein n=1 Tax=Podospora appendiculata TaxID=314037 RepID=A0AAE0WYS9_9PEZI|nr:hypothetical protein B0T22DRAFT_310834 [Podospora appendiculata]